MLVVASKGSLDKDAKPDSNFYMKGRLWLSIVLWLAGLQVVRPQQNFETVPQAASATALTALIPDGTGEVSSTNAIVHKRITAAGPLVTPFKAKKLRDVPKRLWHLVNPFASAERKPALERSPGISTRAWSTTVGWSPGRSAFPDEVTHESTMSFVSFSRTQ